MLLDAVRNHDNELAKHWSECPTWSTLQELMRHTGDMVDSVGTSSGQQMDADMREAIERSLKMR